MTASEITQSEKLTNIKRMRTYLLIIQGFLVALFALYVFGTRAYYFRLCKNPMTADIVDRREYNHYRNTLGVFTTKNDSNDIYYALHKAGFEIKFPQSQEISNDYFTRTSTYKISIYKGNKTIASYKNIVLLKINWLFFLPIESKRQQIICAIDHIEYYPREWKLLNSWKFRRLQDEDSAK